MVIILLSVCISSISIGYGQYRERQFSNRYTDFRVISFR